MKSQRSKQNREKRRALRLWTRIMRGGLRFKPYGQDGFLLELMQNGDCLPTGHYERELARAGLL